MLPDDPYAPPSSALGGLSPAEQSARDSGVLRYPGIWQRIAAQLIDLLVFMPVVVLDVVFGGDSHKHALLMLVLSELASVYFFIYMVGKYGGSPGKLLLGMRIVTLDGAAATMKTAIVRYSVYLTAALALAVLTMIATLNMPEALYQSISYYERGMGSEQEPVIEWITYLLIGWMFACFVALLINQQRRTLHDLMAGTVVVEK